MNNLTCEHCEADITGCEHYPVDKVELDLVHEICELIKRMNAISERMNHFEAWFANVGDRLGTMEKRLDGYEQKLQIWINGRGGMS